MKRSEKRNPRHALLTVVSVTSFIVPSAHSQVTFQFDYSYDTGGFFASQTRKDLLAAAGQALANRLGDALSAVSPSTGNTWSASFSNPGAVGTTTVDNLGIPANTILIYAGGQSLGSGILGQGGAGGWSASGTSDWIATVDRRGSPGSTRNASGTPATDFAPWGGSITFGAGISWYFDSDPSTAESFAGQSDFYSVAVHELAHVLGYGTSDSWNNNRSGSSFQGPASLALNNPLSLSSDLGHWNNGTLSYVGTPGNSQEASMDPDLTVGTRKYFTELDYAGLTDIGWQVSPVPEPAEITAAVGLGLIGFASYRRRLKP